MPLKKTAGKKAESRERVIRARARAAGIKKYGPAKVKGKDVHHKNGNNKDNSPGNLGIKTHTSHGKAHGRGHGQKGKSNIRNK